MKVDSMNLFRLQQIESSQRRSLFPQKRERGIVPISKYRDGLNRHTVRCAKYK
jgi:hypothetical protein